MPFGCFATLRSFSHFLQLIRHSSRQLLCPSCHLVHFFLRYASLHHVRSLTICYKAGHPICFTHSLPHGNAPAFTQAFPTILTGFHFASLRHPFTSVAFSPPAANNFARLAATVCVTGLLWHRTLAYKPMAYATFRPFTVRPSLPMVVLLSAPAGGTRRQFRSYLSPLPL